MSECDPLLAVRRRRKLREMGKPQRVLPHEYQHGMSIIQRAHDSGMSITQMSDQIGVQKSTINQLRAGETETMLRPTYNALLTLRPEPPKRTGETRRGGAKLDPTVTVRRLQALTAAGWTSTAMASYIGMDKRNLSALVLGKVAFVYAITAMDIAKVYDKLQHMDPVADGGVRSVDSERSRRRAARHGWGPPSCWDEDTIDDPDAFPEWTGACGTMHGRVVHAREGIPVCQPCRDAKTRGDVSDLFDYKRFDGDRFFSLLQMHGLSYRQLGERVGVSEDTLYAYRSGIRKPPPERLETIATLLGVDPTELIE